MNNNSNGSSNSPNAFYPDPPWARKPSANQHWTLTEIKGGVEVAEYVLSDRACTILGRAADQVNIPLNHESCSRQHARIAFDSSGIAWLRDCKSTHGTFVNKKRLPPEATGTAETSNTKKGSRGVIVHPGDVFQFGASTRIYCLDGPPEFQRGAPIFHRSNALQRNDNSNNTDKFRSSPDNDDNDNGNNKEVLCSWGIPMDEVGETEENESAIHVTLPESIDLVPKKHQKAMEQINALKYKLTNIQTENDRIRRKGELSEGQQRQLDRNEGREKDLKQQIQEKEEELYKKLNPEQGNALKKSNRYGAKEEDDEDDVDEFYDRTKSSRQQELEADVPGAFSNDEEAETEESLSSKWVHLYEQSQRNKVQLSRATEKASNIQQRLSRMKQAGEEEEAFFVQNDLLLANEAKQKVEQESIIVSRKIQETERLLRIVNPNIYLDREIGYISSSAPPEAVVPMPPPAFRTAAPLPPSYTKTSETTNLSPPPVVGVEFPAVDVGSPYMPPPSTKPVAPGSTSTTASDSEINNSMMPPPKRKRILGPTLPRPDSADPKIDASSEPSKGAATRNNTDYDTPKQLITTTKSKRPVRGPAMGTLAALSKIRSSDSQNKDSQKKSTEEYANQPRANSKSSPPTFDSKKDEWKAPKGQDGSGITKLNAKFAGRY